MFFQKQLIKKPSLDKEQFQNYRPVSNLAYAGKLIKKVVVNQLVNHMQMHNRQTLSIGLQGSAFNWTALMKIHNDFGQALDQGKGMLVLFLDMSAAFNSADPGILSDILSSHVGVEGSALLWFWAYMSARSQRVEVGGVSSRDTRSPAVWCATRICARTGFILCIHISTPDYHQKTQNRLP